MTSPFDYLPKKAGLPGLTDLFGGNSQWQNPADAAQPWLDQIPGVATDYYDPYRQAGLAALPQLQAQFEQLMNNPAAFMAALGKDYQQSPGYQFRVKEATEAANQAAAAGGYAGSPAHQAALSDRISGIANQDYQQYLNNTMNAYNTGLQGFGGLNQMGYNATNQLAQAIMNSLMSQANLAYAGAESENQFNQNQGGAIGKAIGAALPLLL